MLTPILLLLLPVGTIIYLIRQYTFLPSRIPGPFVARFSNAWRALSVYGRRPHEVQLRLHRRYLQSAKESDLVRLGPDTVSVTGPGYIPQIYGIDKKLRKSDFYAVFQNIVNGKRAASLVAMTDETAHAKTKRLVAHAYSLSTLVEFEPLVDSTTEIFLDELQKNFTGTTTGNNDKGSGSGGKEKNRICDFGRWLQFYAFDVIGELTFSRRLGFIETGEDVDSIIASIGANFSYFSVLGQMPWLDETFLGKNPLYVKYFRRPVSSPILKFAQALLAERLDQLDTKQETSKGGSGGEGAKPDFLSRFLQVRAQQQEKGLGDDEEPLSDGQLMSFLFANINAGSDTIASTLRAVFYYLLKHPDTMDRLVRELQAARTAGALTVPCPTWQETQSDTHLAYLRAVIKEALRMNPALSLPLERVVGSQGLTLHAPPASADTGVTGGSATFLPVGTIVGINPYVLHRDARIFDPNGRSDPLEWDPARWLPEDGGGYNTAEQLKTMEHSLLAFGAGKRSCLGKNIAMLELHKLVPAVLMQFKLELENTDKDWQWEVKNAWVLDQKGLRMRLSVRE